MTRGPQLRAFVMRAGGSVAAGTASRKRLRRADCSAPGLRRLRRGRGFVYLDEHANRVEDPDILERVRALAIPPAWQEVWICPDPLGHLQATGIDAAGRKQYLYHPRWREQRDRQKFRRMVSFAQALPELRRQIKRDLRGDDLSRRRVLACATRLLDVGLFRIGSEQYADEDGGVGLATIRKEHVSLRNGTIVFDYPAKSGVRRVQAIEDQICGDLIKSLKRRRGGGAELLAYRDGRRWGQLRSDDINYYLKHHLGPDFSAKDFRTWNATVLAAVLVAVHGGEAKTKTARKRAIDRAVTGVSEVLGNTRAVARRAYIDPRVFDRYLSGWTIGGALERIGNYDAADERTRRQVEEAVIELLTDPEESDSVERIS